MRVSPGVVPRLEFFVVDSTGAPVPSLVRTDFSAFAYSLITDGLYSSAVTVTPSSNVAATAAKSAGQFVTINSAKGHYAVDCPSGAASSVATHVEMSATPNTGTYVVYPVRSDIETKISTLFESVSGSTAPTVERSPTDTKVITFAWPVSGATITATVSKDNGSYAATIGTVSFLRTESGKHFYSLSYNVSDRPTSEGTARYKFVDGTYTRYVNLRVAVAGGGDGGGAESDLMVSTTIATLSSQTVFTLTAGSADNDAYNLQLVVVTDAATSTQKARGIVADYVGSTKTITLTSELAFTISAGDSISIIAIGSDVSSAQMSSAIGSAIVSAGISATVTGMPTFLRVGDARTVANGYAIPVRLYDIDDETLLFGIGEQLFADATITFSLRRAGTDSAEGVEDAAIPCTWVEDGADGYVQIAYEADALDGCDAMDRLKEKDCHRWGVKFQWGIDDPITPIYGNISVLRKIVTTQSS